MTNLITLPKELAEKLQKKIKETDFASIQDYVIYALNQLVVSEENKEEISKEEEVAYTPEEEEELKKRLTEQGYI